MRTGVIAKKLGMSFVYNEKGERVTVTLFKLDQCQVVAHKTEDRHGYNALVLGCGLRKLKNVPKPQRQDYAKKSIEPKLLLKEFRVSSNAFVDVGSFISPAHFVVGQRVDVRGKTIGKGFSGVMKRHNFRGLEATHGVSVTHRSHGSTGMRQDPGKVMKGKKMAGHYGVENVTIQNLEIVEIDEGRSLIAVKGAVPGHKGAHLFIVDSVKYPMNSKVPFPAGIVNKAVEASS